MSRFRMSDTELEWLKNNYPFGTINDTLDNFEKEFHWRPNKQTVYQHAFRLGLRKLRQDPSIRNAKAQVRLCWNKEPEMSAWMLEHDTGSHETTIVGFEKKFGIRLSRGQINRFRAQHGTQQQKNHNGGSPRKPLGYERMAKGGILVKVAENPTVPLSRDNWRYKHHIVFEQAYGPIPEGHMIMAVDGNTCNCDPKNLVSIPRSVVGVLNNGQSNLPSWHDRESLLNVIALAELQVAINDAASKAATCKVCGQEFAETEKQRRVGSRRIQTCPECLAKGLKARGNRCDGEIGICEKCGAQYQKQIRRQRFCSNCSSAKYQKKTVR